MNIPEHSEEDVRNAVSRLCGWTLFFCGDPEVFGDRNTEIRGQDNTARAQVFQRAELNVMLLDVLVLVRSEVTRL